jgi:hypothetical protein
MNEFYVDCEQILIYSFLSFDVMPGKSSSDVERALFQILAGSRHFLFKNNRPLGHDMFVIHPKT